MAESRDGHTVRQGGTPSRKGGQRLKYRESGHCCVGPNGALCPVLMPIVPALLPEYRFTPRSLAALRVASRKRTFSKTCWGRPPPPSG